MYVKLPSTGYPIYDVYVKTEEIVALTHSETQAHNNKEGEEFEWLKDEHGDHILTDATHIMFIGGGGVHVVGNLHDIVKIVECAVLDDHHILVDRGEWTGDETYVPLDYVTKPNTTDTFLCMAENKSSSAGVLSNTSFWCPITLPEKGEDDSA